MMFLILMVMVLVVQMEVLHHNGGGMHGDAQHGLYVNVWILF